MRMQVVADSSLTTDESAKLVAEVTAAARWPTVRVDYDGEGGDDGDAAENDADDGDDAVDDAVARMSTA